MNHFVFSAILVFFTSLAAAIYFIPKKGAERYFGFFWACVAFWTLFVGYQFEIMSKISTHSWGWWLHVGCISVPIVYYHFSLVLTGNPNRILLRAGYGLFLIFLILILRSDLFTAEDVFRTYYHYPKPSLLYSVYVAYFQFYGILSTWQIFELRKKLSPEKTKYLYFFLVVHLMAWAGSMDNYLIMYDKLIFPFYPYGVYFILPYATLGSYAFSKFK